MIPQDFQASFSAVQTLPVTMFFSTKLLLQRAPDAPKPGLAGEGMAESHATQLTAVLKEMEGYEHSGLNE